MEGYIINIDIHNIIFVKTRQTLGDLHSKLQIGFHTHWPCIQQNNTASIIISNILNLMFPYA